MSHLPGLFMVACGFEAVWGGFEGGGGSAWWAGSGWASRCKIEGVAGCT